MRLQVNVVATMELGGEAPALLAMDAKNVENYQIVESSSLEISPKPVAAGNPLVDVYGNACRRMTLPGGISQISYSAVIDQPDARAPFLLAPVQTSILDLSGEALHFLLPSRYCPSDRMIDLAGDMFSGHKPGYATVLAICEWINEHVKYQYGTSNSSTSAIDTFIELQGVCRDFAHLAISMCRALTIPARYVSGYCLGLQPPDFHAYFEAYIDGRWIAFDATELQPRPALIEVAVGRDAADCAWCTLYGSGTTKELSVEVSLVGSEKDSE